MCGPYCAHGVCVCSTRIMNEHPSKIMVKLQLGRLFIRCNVVQWSVYENLFQHDMVVGVREVTTCPALSWNKDVEGKM